MAFLHLPRLDPVDRETERNLFRAMLDGARSERVFAVQAPGLCGKSCLVDLLERDCWDRGLLCARIDFRDSALDYLGLAERLRDQWIRSAERIDPTLALAVRAAFAPFDAAVERTRPRLVPTNIVIGGGTIDASTRDDHSAHIQAGGEVAYQLHASPTPATPVPPGLGDPAQAQERERLLTRVFLDCLETLIQDRLVVCLLDTFEDAQQAGEWFHRHVLTSARERRLNNLVTFLAGQQVPDVQGWRHWAYYQDWLDPLTEDVCHQVAVSLGLPFTRDKVAAHYRILHRAPAGYVVWFYSIRAEEVR